MESIVEVVNATKRQLPLRVQFTRWDNVYLRLWSEDLSKWSLLTICAWRLIKGNDIQCGCYDDRSVECADQLKGLNIINVTILNPAFPVDPVFHFSNGLRLEIFHCETFEAWVLKLPDDQIYVG